MPLYTPPDVLYRAGVLVPNARAWCGSAVTPSGGVATFYPTTTGTAAGDALFSSIFLDSIQPVAFAADRVLIFDTPVIAADRKSITVQVRYNASLLSLGLLPFSAAAAGYTVNLTLWGVV